MRDRQKLKSLLKTGLLLLCLTGIGITGSEVKAEEGDVHIVREASGDMESLIAIEISEESTNELEEWTGASSSQNAENNASSTANQFLTYGSNYGYQDMAKRSNGENRQYAYQQMEQISKNFSVNGQLATETTVSGTVYSVAGTVNLTGRNLTKDEKIQSYFTFRHDNPQYFWLSNAVLYSDNGLTILTYNEYKTGEARQAALEEIVKTAETVYKSQIPSSSTRYDKVKTIHDMLIAEIEYSSDVNRPIAHSIAGAMIEKSAVCEGYAKVMQVMMNCYGINNIYVTGTGNGGGHAWNMVGMDDGKYYWLDATWDDQPYEEYQHKYFLVGDQEFDKHEVDTPSQTTGEGDFLYELPAVSDVKYDPSTAKPVDPNPSVAPYSKGDVNGDGSIDIFDLMACLNHVAGKQTLEGDSFDAADVKEDSVVDLYDLMKILNYIAKGTSF